MRTTVTRAAAVSAGTVVLCLFGGGVAAASVGPLPVPSATPGVTPPSSVPSPGDVVATVTSAGGDTLAKLEQLAGVGSDGSSVAPAKPQAVHRSAPRHATTANATSTRAHTPAASTSVAKWSLPQATTAMSLTLSPAVAAPRALAPAVAPAPAVVQLRTAATPLAPLDNGPAAGLLRGLLVALATAAAAGLAAGHVGFARRGMPLAAA